MEREKPDGAPETPMTRAFRILAMLAAVGSMAGGDTTSALVCLAVALFGRSPGDA